MNRACDFNEDDPTYLKLIRIDHAIWTSLRRERRLKGHTVMQEQPFYDAIEIVVGLKQDRKAELRRLRVIKAVKTREYFENRRSAE